MFGSIFLGQCFALLCFATVVVAHAIPSTVTVNYTLGSDETASGDLTIQSGTVNLNGYTLTVTGTLRQAGGTLTLNGGTLNRQITAGRFIRPEGVVNGNGAGNRMRDCDSREAQKRETPPNKYWPEHVSIPPESC